LTEERSRELIGYTSTVDTGPVLKRDRIEFFTRSNPEREVSIWRIEVKYTDCMANSSVFSDPTPLQTLGVVVTGDNE